MKSDVSGKSKRLLRFGWVCCLLGAPVAAWEPASSPNPSVTHLAPPTHCAACQLGLTVCRRVRFNKHLPTAEALGAYFATYGRHCRTLHLGHLDAASERVGLMLVWSCEAVCVCGTVLASRARQPPTCNWSWMPRCNQ